MLLWHDCMSLPMALTFLNSLLAFLLDVVFSKRDVATLAPFRALSCWFHGEPLKDHVLLGLEHPPTSGGPSSLS